MAPALLVLTALLQISLGFAGPLAPSKGGGFGLFSTVDKMENRILLAWLEKPGGDERLPPSTLDREELDALAFPTDSRLDRLARRLADAPAAGTGVRVEVWKRTFDLQTGESRRVLVAARSVALER